MKICWDNLEKLKYSNKTCKWYNGAGGGYIEKENCKGCGETFLSRDGLSNFCCRKCSSGSINNGMYGKKHTKEVKNFLKQNIKKSQKTIKKKYGVDNISQLNEIKKKKKQFIVNYKNVKKYMSKECYLLLELNGNNKNAKLKIKCPNNHIFYMEYQAWKRGHRCKECYYERMRQQGIQDLDGFELYKKLVDIYTKKSYRKYKNIINPDNVRRGRKTYHLDHKFSKIEGFKNNILPIIIGSYINLQILTNNENCSKQGQCSITKEKLINGYFGKIKFI